MTLTYLRYEVLRTLRNRRFLLFALGFPLVLYLLIASPNRGESSIGGTGISAPLYFMVSLASFGTMNAVLSGGGRIALERTVGWTRQLRISPLSPGAYFRTKVATSYLMALLTMAVLFIAGVALGVRLPAGEWFEVIGLILLALVPFAALAIVMGHVLSSDSVGPALGGGTALLAFVSGTWFPVTSGFVHDLATFLPSYYLVQANRVATDGSVWGWQGFACIAAWTVVLSALAVRVYRRDSGRL